MKINNIIQSIRKFFTTICLVVLCGVFVADIVYSREINFEKAVQLFACSLLVLCKDKLCEDTPTNRKGWLIGVILLSPLYLIVGIYGECIFALEYLAYTYAVILLTWSILSFLIGNVIAAVKVNLFIYTLLHLVNCVVMKFRKNFFFPSDIFSIKTALSVGDAYIATFTVSYQMLSALIALLILGTSIHKKDVDHSADLQTRIIKKTGAFIIMVCTLLLTETLVPTAYVSGEFTTDKKVEKYGYIAVFSLECRALSHTPPNGYNREEAEMFLRQNEYTDEIDKPNIIVILDEAFSDLSLVGELETNKEYMPFFRELSASAQSGVVYVPTWSANTCNTEWEVLTGNSMVFCSGAIPYTQYITSHRDSIASILNEHNYSTVAIHPYYATGYRRDKVYPLLGFDSFVSIEDIDSRYAYQKFDERLNEESLNACQDTHIRDLISDNTSFKWIIREYESIIQNDNNAFIFNLTMQNHAPYTHAGYEKIIETNLATNHPDKLIVEQYLSLISETDAALKELIDYFSHEEEKVIIVFLGDHQPGIGPALYNELWGHEWDYEEWSFEEKLLRYQIPYVMWANYDYELDHEYSTISSNYISLLLMDAAELDHGAWYSFLHELYDIYPVITSAGIMKSTGDWIRNDDILRDMDPIISLYENLQYYRMFEDRKK